MLPKWHILIGFIASYLLVYFFNFSLFAGAVVFLSSVLIDFDHYIYYLLKKKDFSLKRAQNYFIRFRKYLESHKTLRYKYPPLVFHGAEFCIVLLLLSLLSEFFLWVLIGTLLHLILDYSETLAYGQSIMPKISQVYVLVRNKNKPEFR